MRCVGYRQAILHLRGEYGYEEFLERGKAATRQLAKRQMTWLRSMQGVAVIDPLQSGEELLRRLAQDAERILSQLPD
jgi:tRNA dimethylallyltransferase